MKPAAALCVWLVSCFVTSSHALLCYWCSGVGSDRDCEQHPQKVRTGPIYINCRSQYCITAKVTDAKTGEVQSFARLCDNMARGNKCVRDSKLLTCYETCTEDLCNSGNPSPHYLQTLNYAKAHDSGNGERKKIDISDVEDDVQTRTKSSFKVYDAERSLDFKESQEERSRNVSLSTYRPVPTVLERLPLIYRGITTSERSGKVGKDTYGKNQGLSIEKQVADDVRRDANHGDNKTQQRGEINTKIKMQTRDGNTLSQDEKQTTSDVVHDTIISTALPTFGKQPATKPDSVAYDSNNFRNNRNYEDAENLKSDTQKDETTMAHHHSDNAKTPKKVNQTISSSKTRTLPGDLNVLVTSPMTLKSDLASFQSEISSPAVIRSDHSSRDRSPFLPVLSASSSRMKNVLQSFNVPQISKFMPTSIDHDKQKRISSKYLYPSALRNPIVHFPGPSEISSQIPFTSPRNSASRSAQEVDRQRHSSKHVTTILSAFDASRASEHAYTTPPLKVSRKYNKDIHISQRKTSSALSKRIKTLATDNSEKGENFPTLSNSAASVKSGYRRENIDGLIVDFRQHPENRYTSFHDKDTPKTTPKETLSPAGQQKHKSKKPASFEVRSTPNSPGGFRSRTKSEENVSGLKSFTVSNRRQINRLNSSNSPPPNDRLTSLQMSTGSDFDTRRTIIKPSLPLKTHFQQDGTKSSDSSKNMKQLAKRPVRYYPKNNTENVRTTKATSRDSDITSIASVAAGTLPSTDDKIRVTTPFSEASTLNTVTKADHIGLLQTTPFSFERSSHGSSGQPLTLVGGSKTDSVDATEKVTDIGGFEVQSSKSTFFSSAAAASQPMPVTAHDRDLMGEPTLHESGPISFTENEDNTKVSHNNPTDSEPPSTSKPDIEFRPYSQTPTTNIPVPNSGSQPSAPVVQGGVTRSSIALEGSSTAAPSEIQDNLSKATQDPAVTYLRTEDETVDRNESGKYKPETHALSRLSSKIKTDEDVAVTEESQNSTTTSTSHRSTESTEPISYVLASTINTPTAPSSKMTFDETTTATMTSYSSPYPQPMRSGMGYPETTQTVNISSSRSHLTAVTKSSRRVVPHTSHTQQSYQKLQAQIPHKSESAGTKSEQRDRPIFDIASTTLMTLNSSNFEVMNRFGHVHEEDSLNSAGVTVSSLRSIALTVVSTMYICFYAS